MRGKLNLLSKLRTKIALVLVSLIMFKSDIKGEASVNKIIGISVGLVVASIMVPIGINRVLQAENASWGVIGTLFTVLLPVLAILAIVLMFIKK